ncbi:MAG: NADP-dependent isocitrate dehydrogenase [Thermoplasmata archaeon]
MGIDAGNIVVPYISGDGIGPEIMGVARAVVDEAVRRATGSARKIRWQEILAGETAFRKTGQWLPEETVEAIRANGVALKGPLTTPVGGGIRSLNVAIRQALDLYASVRPVRYFQGVPSPVKEPEKMNVVIFRENTEDVYKGVEWKRGSQEALEVLEFLRDRMGVRISPDSGVGIKPISEFASKRLIRAAIRYAIKRNLRSVTLVHKGNIMKFTEGAFRDWGYELARAEFADQVVAESELATEGLVDPPADKIVLKDRIADNMFQQILTRPGDYSVLAAPNLNGDYLADACAAQVGGLGLAPGANIGDAVAVFEPVHGTAPKYAGKDVANPCALMLSGAMMLDHLGLTRASELIIGGIGRVLAEGIMTKDLARQIPGKDSVGTRAFGAEVLKRME